MGNEVDKLLQKAQKCGALLQEIVQDLTKLKAQGVPKKRERRKKRLFQAEEHIHLYSLLLEEWKKGNHHAVTKQLGEMSAEELRAFARANRLPVSQKAPKGNMINDIESLLAQATEIASPVFIRPKDIPR